MTTKTGETETKMKTFKEFSYDVFCITEGLTRDEALKKYERVLRDNPHLTIKNKATAADPDYVIRTKGSIKRAAKERERKIKELTDADTLKRGKSKVKMMRRRKMETHHITPINDSHRLMKSMTPDEWEERKRRDAAIGIYHGHHPRNLQVTSGSKSKNQEGIPHRKGTDGVLGIHELEGRVRDIISGPGSRESSVTLRDLASAYYRRINRNARQGQRRNRMVQKFKKAETARDIDKAMR